jgi:hypothetical protein
MTNSILQWLAQWYSDQCDGEWEHSYGVKIDTLDNPGWDVSIDLPRAMFGRKDQVVVDERDAKEWVFCIIEGNTYKAAGSPASLSRLLEIFRSLVEKPEDAHADK